MELLVILGERCMKSLNRKNLMQSFNEMEIMDSLEISSMFIKNLTQDLQIVFKKYAVVNDNCFSLKIKVLKNNKYIILVDCLAENLFERIDI